MMGEFEDNDDSTQLRYFSPHHEDQMGGSPINNVVSAPETGCNSIENSGTPEATDEPNSDEGAHKGRGPGKSSHSVASGQH